MAVVTCPECGARNRVDDHRARAAQPVCGRCRARLSSGQSGGGLSEPIEVTDETFMRVVTDGGGRPVLVDCWAAWCGPCRMIAPVMDQLAAESGGRYVIAKLNVDENPGVAGRYQVSSIPTMLLFKGGQLVDRIVGLQPKEAIAGRLARLAG